MQTVPKSSDFVIGGRDIGRRNVLIPFISTFFSLLDPSTDKTIKNILFYMFTSSNLLGKSIKKFESVKNLNANSSVDQ